MRQKNRTVLDISLQGTGLATPLAASRHPARAPHLSAVSEHRYLARQCRGNGAVFLASGHEVKRHHSRQSIAHYPGLLGTQEPAGRSGSGVQAGICQQSRLLPPRSQWLSDRRCAIRCQRRSYLQRTAAHPMSARANKPMVPGRMAQTSPRATTRIDAGCGTKQRSELHPRRQQYFAAKSVWPDPWIDYPGNQLPERATLHYSRQQIAGR